MAWGCPLPCWFLAFLSATFSQCCAPTFLYFSQSIPRVICAQDFVLFLFSTMSRTIMEIFSEASQHFK